MEVVAGPGAKVRKLPSTAAKMRDGVRWSEVAVRLQSALESFHRRPVASSQPRALSRRRDVGSVESRLSIYITVTAERWATQSADRHRWRGLSMHGVDRTTFRVPDSPENWAAYGAPDPLAARLDREGSGAQG